MSVLLEGRLATGDSIRDVARDTRGVTISDIVSLYTSGASNQKLLGRASQLAALPPGWRDYFRKRLREPS